MPKHWILIRRSGDDRSGLLTGDYYFLKCLSGDMIEPNGTSPDFTSILPEQFAQLECTASEPKKRITLRSAVSYSQILIVLFGLRRLGKKGLELSMLERQYEDARNQKLQLVNRARAFYNEASRKNQWSHTQFDGGFQKILSASPSVAKGVSLELGIGSADIIFVEDIRTTEPKESEQTSLQMVRHALIAKEMRVLDFKAVKEVVSGLLRDTVVRETIDPERPEAANLRKSKHPLRRDLEYNYRVIEPVTADSLLIPKPLVKYFDSLPQEHQCRIQYFSSELSFYRFLGDFDQHFFRYGILRQAIESHSDSDDRYVVFREYHPTNLPGFSASLTPEAATSESHSQSVCITAEVNGVPLDMEQDETFDNVIYLKFPFKPQEKLSCFKLAEFRFRVFGLRLREHAHLAFRASEDTLSTTVNVDFTDAGIDRDRIRLEVFGGQTATAKYWQNRKGKQVRVDGEGGFSFPGQISPGDGGIYIWGQPPASPTLAGKP